MLILDLLRIEFTNNKTVVYEFKQLLHVFINYAKKEKDTYLENNSYKSNNKGS